MYSVLYVHMADMHLLGSFHPLAAHSQYLGTMQGLIFHSLSLQGAPGRLSPHGPGQDSGASPLGL